MHRHRAGPVGEKAATLSGPQGNCDPYLRTVFPAGTTMRYFFVALAFFFYNCYKRVLAFREDSWVKSTNQSSGCLVWSFFLLPSENLTMQSLLPPSSTRQKNMFSTYRNTGDNAVSLIILSRVLFLISLENTDPP